MASPGYRRCPQDTAYPQDTDSVLRIPRYPQDTAGVLRYNYRHDAAVSSGYRVPRMPSVSQDANSRLQMYSTHQYYIFKHSKESLYRPCTRLSQQWEWCASGCAHGVAGRLTRAARCDRATRREWRARPCDRAA